MQGREVYVAHHTLISHKKWPKSSEEREESRSTRIQGGGRGDLFVQSFICYINIHDRALFCPRVYMLTQRCYTRYEYHIFLSFQHMLRAAKLLYSLSTTQNREERVWDKSSKGISISKHIHTRLGKARAKRGFSDPAKNTRFSSPWRKLQWYEWLGFHAEIGSYEWPRLSVCRGPSCQAKTLEKDLSGKKKLSKSSKDQWRNVNVEKRDENQSYAQ